MYDIKMYAITISSILITKKNFYLQNVQSVIWVFIAWLHVEELGCSVTKHCVLEWLLHIFLLIVYWQFAQQATHTQKHVMPVIRDNPFVNMFVHTNSWSLVIKYIDSRWKLDKAYDLYTLQWHCLMSWPHTSTSHE